MQTDPDRPRYEPSGPGTISKMAAQRKNPNRVSIFFDDTYAFGLHQDLVLEHGLYKGRTLSIDEQRELLSADQLLVAKSMALHYLAQKPRTRHEIRQRLQRRGFGEATIEQALERVEELGYVDDAAYAKSYALGRFRAKGYGPQRIRSELFRRGVRSGLIDAALEQLTDEEDPIEAARAHAEKRWARLEREPDAYKRRKKLTDFLLRRGFSYDTIRQVVDELEARS